MKPPSQVVELNIVERPRPNRMTLPPILLTVQQVAKKQISELLQGLFNHIDDTLFELADRSISNTDQHTYFEAMREIRLKRQSVVTDCLEELEQGFTAIYEGAEDDVPGPPAITDLDLDSDSLTLVNNDDLEISVANAGIVSKVTSQYSLVIMQLTKRIDHLCKVQIVTERLNPLGPHQLSNVFTRALEAVDVEIKIKIILIKLFERFVMERMGDVYHSANKLLAEAGVLPDLRHLVRKSAQRRQRPIPEQSTNTKSDAPTTQEIASNFSQATDSSGFRSIQRLLASVRSSEGGGSNGSDMPGSGIGGSHPGSNIALTTEELLSVLNNAQNEMSAAPLEINSAPQLLDLRQLVLARSQHASMDQSDDDVVNFVGMLFDYILNDRNLAIPMKALIARLQIPIVKLAVIDKSFFSKPNHPARQLLNALSSAGIGWSSAKELKRDALYNEIESVVIRVLNGFSDTPNIFECLVDELQQFISKDERRNAIVEQRVKETETGKAKSEAAKRDVQQLINQKAAGIRLPTAVGRFISETWSKVLVYIAVTSGTDSDDWRASIKTMDNLLWSVQSLDTAEQIAAREDQQANLLQDIMTGVCSINVSDQDAEFMRQALEVELNQVSEHDRAFLVEDEPPPTEGAYQEMEKIVLTTVDLAEEAAVEQAPPPEFLEQINQIVEGVWVEMKEDDGELLRAKLSTIVQPGDKYVFVNRRGMKVAEKNRMSLAILLKESRLKILNESQVFDRALQAVIGNLRHMHRNPQESS